LRHESEIKVFANGRAHSLVVGISSQFSEKLDRFGPEALLVGKHPPSPSSDEAWWLAYTFGGGKGSRTGSGLSLVRTALRVRMRGENG
jgi:hypothetical protein